MENILIYLYLSIYIYNDIFISLGKENIHQGDLWKSLENWLQFSHRENVCASFSGALISSSLLGVFLEETGMSPLVNHSVLLAGQREVGPMHLNPEPKSYPAGVMCCLPAASAPLWAAEATPNHCCSLGSWCSPHKG